MRSLRARRTSALISRLEGRTVSSGWLSAVPSGAASIGLMGRRGPSSSGASTSRSQRSSTMPVCSIAASTTTPAALASPSASCRWYLYPKKSAEVFQPESALSEPFPRPARHHRRVQPRALQPRNLMTVEGLLQGYPVELAVAHDDPAVQHLVEQCGHLSQFRITSHGRRGYAMDGHVIGIESFLRVDVGHPFLDHLAVAEVGHTYLADGPGTGIGSFQVYRCEVRCHRERSQPPASSVARAEAQASACSTSSALSPGSESCSSSVCSTSR